MRRSFWLLPDPHIGHTKLSVLHRESGFEDIIFKNVSKLPDKDILIVLGDFIFKKHGYLDKWLEVVANKTVWLVRGNHDNETIGWYLDRGFCVVADEIKVNMFGINILLTHIPVKRHDYDVNVHGHLHGNSGHRDDIRLHKRNCPVDIEHKYAPLNLQSVVQSHMAQLDKLWKKRWEK